VAPSRSILLSLAVALLASASGVLRASATPTRTPQSYLVDVSVVAPASAMDCLLMAKSVGCLGFSWYQAKAMLSGVLAIQFVGPASGLACIPGYVGATPMTAAQVAQCFPAPGPIKRQPRSRPLPTPGT
jgi:hypothetical protein